MLESIVKEVGEHDEGGRGLIERDLKGMRGKRDERESKEGEKLWGLNCAEKERDIGRKKKSP